MSVLIDKRDAQGAVAGAPGAGTRSGWRYVGRRIWQMLRTVRRGTLGWRRPLAERAPPWARRTFGPTAVYLDMLIIDHGIVRLAYLNRHRLDEKAWRSAQPAPHQIGALARQGLRTVINLRGQRLCGSYWLERAACERQGIAMVDFQIHSRSAPSRVCLRAAFELFDRIEYPVLMHCKSGADRAGLMSALYCLKMGMTVAEAQKQLALRYGHLRQSDTGILDRFLETYLAHNLQRPTPFIEWVDTVYDPEELKRSFRAGSLASRFVDRVLKRE